MSITQKDTAYCVRIRHEAGNMKPTPTLASTLSSKKVKLPEFLKAANEQTKNLKNGTPVSIITYIDKKGAFKIQVTAPHTTYLLKEAAKVSKGVAQVKKMPDIATITPEQLTEIAQIKMNDLSAKDIEAAEKIIKGTAASMGIQIKGK